ncbi:hypothetical protein OROMI_013625 [Orobanche minor]
MEFGRFLRKCYRVNHTQTRLVIQYSSVGIARGNVEEGLRLRDKMMLKGLKFNGISYRTLISSLCRNGQINEALSLLSELSDGDVEPDLFLYSMINIIHGLCKLGEVEKAVQLYKIYIKVGDLAEAIRLYENLLKKGSDPTIVTFNTLINGLCKAGKLDLARKWLDDMKMLNVVPAIVTYTTIMNAFCEVGNLKATYGNDNKWFGTKSHNLHSTYERAVAYVKLGTLKEHFYYMMRWSNVTFSQAMPLMTFLSMITPESNDLAREEFISAFRGFDIVGDHLDHHFLGAQKQGNATTKCYR